MGEESINKIPGYVGVIRPLVFLDITPDQVLNSVPSCQKVIPEPLDEKVLLENPGKEKYDAREVGFFKIPVAKKWFVKLS